MIIVRALSLAFFVAIFSLALSNQELVAKYVASLHISADASEVVFQASEGEATPTKDFSKPTFMQVEKINQHELPAQARIGYLLSRGF